MKKTHIGQRKEADLNYLWEQLEMAAGEVDMPDEVYHALAKLSGVEIFALAAWLSSFIRRIKKQAIEETSK